MKTFLIGTLLIFSTNCYCQDTLSKKSIDSLIYKIDNLTQIRVVNVVNKGNAFDTIRGIFRDTSFSIYITETATNSLVKYTYVCGAHNTNEIFYFNKDRLIAVKLISEDEFPSWSWSTHYFTKPFSFKKGEFVVYPAGSEGEEILRKHLMYAGWNTINVYNASIRKGKNKIN